MAGTFWQGSENGVGVDLELSRELLPSPCTDASLFFRANIGQLPLSGQELRAAGLRQGGVVPLGFLDAEHHQGIVFYFVLTSCFKIKLSTIMLTYCLEFIVCIARSNPSTDPYFLRNSCS